MNTLNEYQIKRLFWLDYIVTCANPSPFPTRSCKLPTKRTRKHLHMLAGSKLASNIKRAKSGVALNKIINIQSAFHMARLRSGSILLQCIRGHTAVQPERLTYTRFRYG